MGAEELVFVELYELFKGNNLVLAVLEKIVGYGGFVTVGGYKIYRACGTLKFLQVFDALAQLGGGWFMVAVKTFAGIYQ